MIHEICIMEVHSAKFIPLDISRYARRIVTDERSRYRFWYVAYRCRGRAAMIARVGNGSINQVRAACENLARASV